MKRISVVTGCYNEADNIEALYHQVKAVFARYDNYAYEHIFIDNASTDKTVAIIKTLCAQDKQVKLIVNAGNFGASRSSFYAISHASGDAVIAMAADLQDPPSVLPEFIQQWEAGYKIVVGVKISTDERFPWATLRRCYYALMSRVSDIPLVEQMTGFGLYDRQVLDVLKTIDDSYPYFRGLVSEMGFSIAKVPFHQPLRKHGVSSETWSSLYNLAWIGITRYTSLPIRLLTLVGGLASLISCMVFVFHAYRGEHAIMLDGVLLLSSLQLIFLGIVGEYVLSIHRQVFKRPLVIEKERVNFFPPEQGSS